MKIFLKTIVFFLLIGNTTYALEKKNKTLNKIDTIKKKSSNIFKILSRKSLNLEQSLKFIAENVILIDDKKGDGKVVYYFKNKIYKRYKNLEVISEDKWQILRSGHLRVYDNSDYSTWKIQLGEKNKINIKKKKIIGELFEFSYEDKTDFYLRVEIKKLRENKSN